MTSIQMLLLEALEQELFHQIARTIAGETTILVGINLLNINILKKSIIHFLNKAKEKITLTFLLIEDHSQEEYTVIVILDQINQ